MSVLASKRKIADVQFVTTAISLQKDVHRWCLAQSRKLDHYGLVRLYQAAESISVAAITLNSIYANTVENVKRRMELAREVEMYIHIFNAQLTSIYPLFNIKHKRAKRWSHWANTESNLIYGVKRADQKRLNRLIAKEQNNQ